MPALANHHVEPTQRFDCVRDHAADLPLVANVGNGRHRPASFRLNMLGYRRRSLFTHVDDSNCCPGPSQRVAGALANARPTVTYKSNLICERSIHTGFTVRDQALTALDIDAL
jgi:hypothetical protein